MAVKHPSARPSGLSSGGRWANAQKLVNDAEANQRWTRLLMKSSDDPMTIRLYALRDGLCAMVDRGQVKLGVATAIFEDARSPEVMECFRNQK